MKKVMYISFLFALGIVFLGGMKIDTNLYDEVRKNQNDFTQGLKIQYELDEDEYQLLKNNKNFQFYDDDFYYKDNKSTYSIEVKCIDYFLEVELTNIKDEIKIEKFESILKEKLKDKNNLKIFTYVKSKVSEGHSLDTLEYVEKIDKINIVNGETGIIKLKGGQKFNYSIINYGKDNNYIIVGSPVIFISY
ncbi:MAG: hypothetical protein ACRC41_17835 [Sarcina sp.]